MHCRSNFLASFLLATKQKQLKHDSQKQVHVIRLSASLDLLCHSAAFSNEKPSKKTVSDIKNATEACAINHLAFSWPWTVHPQCFFQAATL